MTINIENLAATGFANGAKFETENEVNQYFTVETMAGMFGSDHGFTQDELDAMAEYVITTGCHMVGGRRFEN